MSDYLDPNNEELLKDFFFRSELSGRDSGTEYSCHRGTIRKTGTLLMKSSGAAHTPEGRGSYCSDDRACRIHSSCRGTFLMRSEAIMSRFLNLWWTALLASIDVIKEIALLQEQRKLSTMRILISLKSTLKSLSEGKGSCSRSCKGQPNPQQLPAAAEI